MKIYPAALCILLMLSAFHPQKALTQSSPDFKRLADSIQSILLETKAPGAQVAVFTRDTLLWNQSFGVQDVEGSIPVDESTFFRIGSITKTFVATAVLQLVEQGKLALDDPISKYLEDVEYKNKFGEKTPILIEHLLEHTAGFDDMHMPEYASKAEGWTLREGIDFHPDNRYARWRPGTHMSYCNSGPPMAAYIVERITGKNFDDYVRDHIFLPLRMEYSSLLATDEVKQRLSKGYDSDGVKEMEYWHVSQRPAGSINSNSMEMSRFIRMLLNRGNLDSVHILSQESLKRMESCQTTLAGKAGIPEGYGLHNYTTNYKGMVFHGHDGGMLGFLAQAKYHPESGYGYVILVNAANGALNQISKQVCTRLFEAAGYKESVASVDLSENEKEHILGFYRSATSRNQMFRLLEAVAAITKVGLDEEGFFVRNQLGGKKMRATAVASNVLVVENEDGFRSPMVFSDHGGRLYAQQVNWMANLVKSNAIAAFAPLVLTGLTLLLAGLLAVWSIFWLPLKGMGLFTRGRPALRWIPLGLAVITFLYVFSFIRSNEGNILENLGTMSIWSTILFICSLLIPLFMLAFVWQRMKTRVEDESRVFRVWSLALSVLFLLSAFYLFYFDMVGLRTWAY